MPKRRRASKRDSHGKLHVRHDGKARLPRAASPRLRRKLTIVAKSTAMILFCSNR
jgi:hypothetical protein